ncbi:TIGR03936 family radical SAM-associated protein [Thermogutta sp.]|jgi:radical SAM-linked protein|uniref:TIGR03936 family radical SAM-associated protein n=1 Tax=Thermogutta sp. TaxID=1962930 RepID=UPI0032205F39
MDRLAVRQRVRIRFSKTGDLRFIGHHDLVRTLERLFRRAELPLAFSQGFHPKPKISFPLALALGLEGHNEVLELELTEALSTDEILARLQRATVPGLAFHSVEPVPPGTRKAQVSRVTYEIRVPSEREGMVRSRLDAIDAHSRVEMTQQGQAVERNLLDHLLDWSLKDGRLSFTLRVDPCGSLHPREVLRILGLDDLESQGIPLVRSRVEVVS